MKKITVAKWLGAALLSINIAFAAPQDAVNQVRQNASQVLTILKKANGKNDAVVKKEAENYALPYFDFERMTRTAVGVQWNQATPAQKAELVKEVKTLLVRTYSQQMLAYKNAKVEINNKPIERNGGKVVDVNAVVTPTGKQPVKMTFSTAPHGNKYLVHNVVIEGVINLVVAQNKQFAPILKQKGIDGLIADLKAKNGSK